MENQDLTPGSGLTIYIGSDSYAYTLLESFNNKIIIIQKDNVEKINNEYIYSADPNGVTEYLKLYRDNKSGNNFWYFVKKNELTGRFNKKNKANIKFGERKFYLDPSF